MRRLLVGLVVAASAALVPTWALAGNQEVAEQIAASLKDSGLLHGYKIGVKYQEGTAWLRGQVASREQMNTALQLVYKTPGVTRVVNNLVVASEQAPRGPVATQSPPAAAPLQQPLQQVDGAVAAEQHRRPVSREMRGSQMQLPVVGSEPVVETPKPIGRADRVGSLFAPSPTPQVNVTALQEPTLAPPRAPTEADPSAPEQPTPPPVAVTHLTAAGQAVAPRGSRPLPIAYVQAAPPAPAAANAGAPAPIAAPAPQPASLGAPIPAGQGGVQYDHPNLPNYAWPTYAAYPNYAAVTYPKQYSPTAWPYIGPFYPYPQVPLGWRKVVLEWHDGWWNLNFDDGSSKGMFSGLFRPFRH